MKPQGRARRRSQPKALGTALTQVLGELGMDAAVAAFQIAERWEEIVGPEVARHCRPLQVRGEVLEAEVDAPVWAQQLQLRRPELLAAMSRTLGEDAPKDLRFRVGYTRRP